MTKLYHIPQAAIDAYVETYQGDNRTVKSALEAAAPELLAANSGWLPIESIPKILGVEFDLWIKGLNVRLAECEFIFDDENDKWYIIQKYTQKYINWKLFQFSHWMPAPQPPKEV